MDDHAHDWVPYLPDAEGFYFNPLYTDGKFSCRGRVMRCAGQPCDTYLFVPHNIVLLPVEASLAA